MSSDVVQKMATATATTSIVKTEIMSTSAGPIWHITPILIKEEPSEIHVTKIVDAYKDELPAVPENLFDKDKMGIWWHLSDDIEIPPKTDSNEATNFVDGTLTVYNLENIENRLARVKDGFMMAAAGYEDIRCELPNLNSLEIPKMMEQIPMPQLNVLSKLLQQLLTKTRQKTIIKKFVQQLLSEGQSIHNISKEYALPYNLVYEVAHGIKHPSGSQYQQKRAGSPKPSNQKKKKWTTGHHNTKLSPFRTTTSSQCEIYP